MRLAVSVIFVAVLFRRLSLASTPGEEQSFQQWHVGEEYLIGLAVGVPVGGGDCNDNDPQVHPGQYEIPGNLYGDDCDGLADEDQNNVPSDDNNDGDGVAIAAGDCDDRASSIRPGIAEIIGNLVDDDCDGLADEDANNNPSVDVEDHDNDGHFIWPHVIFFSGFESSL